MTVSIPGTHKFDVHPLLGSCESGDFPFDGCWQRSHRQPCDLLNGSFSDEYLAVFSNGYSCGFRVCCVHEFFF